MDSRGTENVPKTIAQTQVRLWSSSKSRKYKVHANLFHSLLCLSCLLHQHHIQPSLFAKDSQPSWRTSRQRPNFALSCLHQQDVCLALVAKGSKPSIRSLPSSEPTHPGLKLLQQARPPDISPSFLTRAAILCHWTSRTEFMTNVK